MYLSKTPKILKAMYPDLTWDIPTQKRVVYLTFDDGPIPEITKWVLDELIKFNAQAIVKRSIVSGSSTNQIKD